MKTYEEILLKTVCDTYGDSYTIEKFFHFGDWLSKKDVLLVSVKLYTEQFIDTAAKTVKLDCDDSSQRKRHDVEDHQIIECCDGQSNDMIVFIDKQPILSLKDHLK